MKTTVFVAIASFAASNAPYLADTRDEYFIYLAFGLTTISALYAFCLWFYHRGAYDGTLFFACGFFAGVCYGHFRKEWLVGLALFGIIGLVWKTFHRFKYYDLLKGLWLWLFVAESWQWIQWTRKNVEGVFYDMPPQAVPDMPALVYWHGAAWHLAALTALTAFLFYALYYRHVVAGRAEAPSDALNDRDFYLLLALPGNFVAFAWSFLIRSYGHVALYYEGAAYGFIRHKNGDLKFVAFALRKNHRFLAIKLPVLKNPSSMLNQRLGTKWTIGNNCYSVADRILTACSGYGAKRFERERLCGSDCV